jgi:hypothetical protein
MKKLKDKLIHLFGGLTEEDVRIRVRHVPVRIEQQRIEKIRICHIVSPERPEYYTYAKQRMAYGICDKMLESGLIRFESDTDPSGGIKLTATAMVVHPEVI